MPGGVFRLANFFGITLRESANDGSDFTNPDADYRRMFLGESGCLYVRDSSGAITQVGVGAGTAMPGSPNTGLRFFRTDHGLEYYYDGTRWVSHQLFSMQGQMRAGATVQTTETGDISSTVAATTGTTRIGAPSVGPGSDIYLVSIKTVFIVNSGGTALGASHKWVGTYVGLDTNIGSTGTVATTNIDSGSSGVYRTLTTSIGLVQAAGTLFYQHTWTKTGTPGSLSMHDQVYYRIIAT